MRTGPASSPFLRIVAVTAINGQRNEDSHANRQQSRHKAPVTSVGRQAGALHEGSTVAPGQLLLAQLVGQSLPALPLTHRQGVAAYPSLESAYQVISRNAPLQPAYMPAPGTSLFDFEI
ncbi:MAG: hypothetical protein ACTSX7_20575 [Alphaproteobacteria bacterium]